MEAGRERQFLAMLVIAAATCLGLEAASPPAEQKITAEEVVARHLDSIGTPEARAAIRNRVIYGTSQAIMRSTGDKLEGNAVLVSEGGKSLIAMVFPALEYPHEKMGYDGKSVSVGVVPPGLRTAFGNFLLTHDVLFKEGLLGGSLIASWAMSDAASHDAKLEYAGTRTVEKRRAHCIKFLPRKGSDLEVSLYFDTETFQHLRSEYNRFIGARMANRPELAPGQRETRYKLVEDFADFQAEEKLTLPHTYRLSLSTSGQRGSLMIDWVLKLTQFQFNQEIDPKTYDVSGN